MYNINELNIKYATDEHHEYVANETRGRCLDAKRNLEQIESSNIIMGVLNEIFSSRDGKALKKVLSRTLDTFSQKDIIEFDKKILEKERR